MNSAHSMQAASEFQTSQLQLRHELRPLDRPRIREIVATTGMFSAAEVEVADELVVAALARGSASGYWFTIAELSAPNTTAVNILGYACHGPIAATLGSYDLYWICVDPVAQGRGVGRLLLADVERQIINQGGRKIYIETSGTAGNTPTQQFYQRCGYRLEACIADFYKPGDDKLIYTKTLPQDEPSASLS